MRTPREGCPYKKIANGYRVAIISGVLFSSYAITISTDFSKSYQVLMQVGAGA